MLIAMCIASAIFASIQQYLAYSWCIATPHTSTGLTLKDMNIETIPSGSILGIEKKGFIWSIVKFVQHLGGLQQWSKITHTGTALWVGNVLYSVEMDGSCNVLRQVAQHINEGSVVNVYKSPVNLLIYLDAVTADSVSYDYVDILLIGIRLLTGWDIVDKTPNEAVCSSFTANWLLRCGWEPEQGFPTLPSPAEVIRELNLHSDAAIV